MNNFIPVKLDIYRNFFSDNPEKNYCYDNIEPLNHQDLEKLNDFLNKNVDSELLYKNQPFMPMNKVTPISQGLICKIDLEKQKFIF